MTRIAANVYFAANFAPAYWWRQGLVLWYPESGR